jgi:hypothetical protein
MVYPYDDQFNPIENLFPDMECRMCNARNPFAFLAPKPDSPGLPWVCVCSGCAEKAGWIDPMTGNLMAGYSV